MLRVGAMLALGLLLPSTALSQNSHGKVSQKHQLAPGVTIEPGSVAFFSDLHMAYGRDNRKANPIPKKNMVAIANLLRTTPEVSSVVFGGDYYHAPGMKDLSVKQKQAALVRGLAGFDKRLGSKPLHVVFGNHDVPLQQSGDARGYSASTAKQMADALTKKNINVIGTDYDKSYGFRLPDGALLNVGHAPNASSSTIAKAMRKMRFSEKEHTDRAREKMSRQPRPNQGEWVSGDSHVLAYSRGKTTIVNMGTAGSGSRPVGDPFTVVIRQPTRGWMFLKPTPNGFVPHDPRGSRSEQRTTPRRR